MSVYYNFVQFNNTDQPVSCNQTDVRLVPLVNRADDYELQIIKFVLPSQSIEVFNIENENDYRIQYSMPTNGTTPSPIWSTVTASRSMPQRTTNGLVKIYSVNDWIELWNRTSLATYRDLLENINALPIHITKHQDTATGSISALGSVTSSNIDISLLDGLPNDRLAYIKVAGTITSIPPSSVELQLISPSGSKNIICSNKQISGAFLFEDASLINQSSLTTLSGSMQPLESFIVHNPTTVASTGIWRITVVNKNTDASQPFQLDYSLTLTVYTCPKVKMSEFDAATDLYFPRIAPTLYLTNDSLVLTYDQNLSRSGFAIGLSPKMYQIMGFKGYKVNNYYLLDIPQTANMEDSTLSIITYQQPSPTAYKLMDIAEIVIESSTLPILGEANNIDGAPIIQSINTSSTDINTSIFEFYSNDIESRTYALVSDQPINNVNIQVFVRYSQDNSLRPVLLSPYSRFSMLLKFKRK